MSLLRRVMCRTTATSLQLFTSRCASSKDTDAPLDLNTALARPEDLEKHSKLSGTITVPTAVDLSPISGVPSQQLKERRVRIHIPPKNAMQSGTNYLNKWLIEFDNRERWENPLMGWASSGDPLSNLNLQFGSKNEAITYCERNGWRWYVDRDSDRGQKPKKQRFKSYGVNFSWNKRTRLSTK
ncbi:NADH dehydrogenase [ubiquinone] iron-sulfur protein 4, mitochondrial-like isoform X1 [Drosophila pseudoobscura]|uniref:NADH dehydrogenase [ubiquinone] iron-sulfur protein 4, mitochondrial n=2 Tax=Drosophila pseudoobscura pseudoobscura TaxID=46245 RepID=A0A6I8V212_DROPS|nr:NADH dehydrogenase [ubiquinone] iron-sulfur protein 4, mitochondrial isoform X1 [Drosophila pseudoobscura]